MSTGMALCPELQTQLTHIRSLAGLMLTVTLNLPLHSPVRELLAKQILYVPFSVDQNPAEDLLQQILPESCTKGNTM